MAIPGIQEIQTLATKYSKTQLQKMAQMGLIDTTKAVMAGMMIDRISKQNMAPPATTVAEDALTPPQAPPQAAPQGPPQMGPGGAPPQASAGIAALQSNIPEMAGGGIVAFADGGDMPSYKEDGLVSQNDFPVVTKSQQKLMDTNRFQILADELRQEQALAASKTGIDKLRHEKNIEMIQREMRTIKPAPAASSLPVSSAAAGTILVNAPPTAPAAAVSAQPNARPKGSSERLMESQVLDEYGIGQRVLTPEQIKASQESAARATERSKKQEQLRKLEGGYFSQNLLTDEQAKEAERLRNQINSLDTLPPINAPKKVDAVVPPGPEVFQPKVDVAPPSDDQNVPMIRKERGAPEDFTKIDPQQIAVPEATSLKAERERREGAYSEAGVDTNMYKEMMAEVASRKEGGAKKREQALGMALMMTGLGLVGARRGKEFQTLSGAGRQALAQFQGTMDNIVANEDKLDNMVRELKMAENNYKKTGAESDLARVRAREDKIETIGIKNNDLKQAADIKSKELFVHLQGVTKPGPVVEATNEILKDMRATNPKATFQDAFRAYSTTGMKGGEISPTTAFKEYNDLKIADLTGKFKKDYPEFKDYWADLQKGMGSIAPQGPAMPTAEHIKQLQANPNMRSDFDAKFGPGSAARILGK
jgi:hypothetical protein